MFTNLDTVWRRGQNTSSPCSLDSALDLSEDELEMLRLYRALPKSEQQAQLSELRARVENFNRLFTELLEARKRNKHQ